MAGNRQDADVSGSVLLTRNEVRRMIADINTELDRLDKLDAQTTALRASLREQKYNLIKALDDANKIIGG
jgi:hypothetical protein